uniref:40S ribosomal protein S27 n=2 Tax=Psittaciformes TaxID=9223 RepID=A0A8V5GCB5_MELUD
MPVSCSEPLLTPALASPPDPVPGAGATAVPPTKAAGVGAVGPSQHCGRARPQAGGGFAALSLCVEPNTFVLCPPQLAKDLVHPSAEDERRKHKKKRLVQSPNSYFMDVKCPGCYKITTVFSHAQTVVLCVGCSTVLCQPTGGKARLTEGKRQCLVA